MPKTTIQDHKQVANNIGIGEKKANRPASTGVFFIKIDSFSLVNVPLGIGFLSRWGDSLLMTTESHPFFLIMSSSLEMLQ